MGQLQLVKVRTKLIANSLLICMHACAVSCGPPPSITNGSPGQPTSTMVRGEVTYTCDTGFIVIGSETITCLSTGNWSSSPSCQSKFIIIPYSGPVIFVPCYFVEHTTKLLLQYVQRNYPELYEYLIEQYLKFTRYTYITFLQWLYIITTPHSPSCVLVPLLHQLSVWGP